MPAVPSVGFPRGSVAETDPMNRSQPYTQIFRPLGGESVGVIGGGLQ